MINKSLLKISEVIWNDFRYNKALFAISSLWLWHATRTLPVIKYYLDKDFFITILSYWNTFNFLKKELKEYKNINFIKLADYPKFERWTWWKFYWYLFIDWLNFNKTLIQEYNFVRTLWENFDFIFSDWRLGVYKKKTPSFLLTHQISYEMPKWLKYLKNLVNYSNYGYFKKFDAIFIPDYEDEKDSLAWELSHTSILKKLKHYYIWTLTSYDTEINAPKDIDYYFIISWYLEEHKESFVKKLIEESKKLKWKKVFVLWDANNRYIRKDKKNNITIYSSVSSKQRLEFFSKSKIVISRSGYTTIMDLYANWKKALLFPTKNQTEQEYLASYLDKKAIFINWWQDDFDLVELISRIK